jgi:hypothetical protein
MRQQGAFPATSLVSRGFEVILIRCMLLCVSCAAAFTSYLVIRP